MNKRCLLFGVLIVFTFIIGISDAKAVTISEDGEYGVSFEVLNGNIDGSLYKLVKFDFEEGETSVTLSDLLDSSVEVLSDNGYTFEGWSTYISDEGDIVTSFTKDEIINTGNFGGYAGDFVGKIVYASFNENSAPAGMNYVTLNTSIGLLDGEQFAIISSTLDGVSIDLSSYVPVKEGYTFKGWYMHDYDDDYGRFVTKRKTEIVLSDMPSDDNNLKLYATWESNTLDMNKKRYILNTNGGKYSNGSTSVTYNFENSKFYSYFILPHEIPTREGYVFTGWTLNSDGTGYEIVDLDTGDFRDPECDDSYGMCEGLDEITLYARWRDSADINDEGEYAVLFKAGLEPYANVAGVKEQLIKFDLVKGATNVDLKNLIYSPFFDGKEFLGWTGTNSFQILSSVSAETLEEGSFTYKGETYKGIVVNPRFSDYDSVDLSKYYLVLNACLGDFYDIKYLSLVSETDEFPINLNEYIPEKDGYTFKGWFKERFDNKTSITYYDKKTSLTASDFDSHNFAGLVAGWESDSVDTSKPTYTLNANGGKLNGANSKTFNYEFSNPDDSEEVFLLDSSVPVREGYSFGGWRNTANGKLTYYIPNKGQTNNYNFEAYWIEKRYTGATSKVFTRLYGYDDVKVSWYRVSDASAYKIYYKKSTSTNYSYLATTTNCYKYVSNLADGTKYYFKVVAIKDGDSSIKYKTYTIYTLKKLNTPVVSKYSKNYVKVRWNNIYGETGYEIARSKYKTKNFYTVKRVSSSYSSSVIKTPRGYTYYYKVRAYKTVDGKRIYGPWSYLKSYRLR